MITNQWETSPQYRFENRKHSENRENVVVLRNIDEMFP